MTKNKEGNDFERSIQTAIYMFKVNNRNIRTNWEICSKSRAKTPDRLNSDFAANASQKRFEQPDYQIYLILENVAGIKEANNKDY